jgi:hypothetical protein
MRLSLYIRPDLIVKLKQLAWQEHRQPRQQAEWMLQKELERLANITPAPTTPEVSHAQQR